MTVMITNINFAKLRDGKPNSPNPLERIPAEQSPDPVYKNNYMRIVAFLQKMEEGGTLPYTCLLYTSPSPRDRQKSRMPSSA